MKLRIRIVAAAILLVVVVCAACERKPRQIGAPQSGSPAPVSSVSADAAAAAQSAHVVYAAPSAAVKAVLNAQELYVKNCAACHQVNGQGIPPVFPPLAASSYVVGANVERLASIMLYGLIGPVHVNGVLYNGAMVGLGPVLSDEELSAIATYVRTSWLNKTEPVDPGVFAEMRKKWGSRGPFLISELGEDK